MTNVRRSAIESGRVARRVAFAIAALVATRGAHGAQATELALPSPEELRTARTAPLAPPATTPAARAAATPARGDLAQLYDLGAFASSLGDGIAPAFDFVRDSIAFVSYSGSLRGAAATFTAREGNALDRADLLAELLRVKGIATRFAQGRLAHGDAEALVQRIFVARSPRRDHARHDASTDGDAPSGATGDLVRRLRARAVRDYATVRGALGDALAADAATPLEELLHEVELHTWIEAQVGGSWIALDPAFAGATPGRAFAAAERTFATIPDEQRQLMAIRVVVETTTGARAERKTVFEQTLPSAALLDQQIFFTHLKGGAADTTGGLAGAIRSSAGGDEWVPTLWIAGDTSGGEPIAFDLGGKAAARGAPPSGGLGSIFGRPPPAAAPTAEWLEFEAVAPGGRRDLTRRSLDVHEPRALLSLWFTAGRHDLSAVGDAARTLAAIAPDLHGELEFGWKIWPFALASFTLPLLSDHLVVPALNDRADLRLYADSPRLTIVALTPHGDDVELSCDLRCDRLRGVAESDAARGAVAERKLWFAALEGALEHEVTERLAAAVGDDPAAVVSTSALLGGGEVALERRGAALWVVPKAPRAGAPCCGFAIEARGDARAVLGDRNGSDYISNGGNPNVQGGGGKVYTTSGESGGLGGAESSLPGGNGSTGRAAPKVEDLMKQINDMKRKGRAASSLDPKEAKQEKGGATEYVATVKLAAKSIVIVVAPLLAEYAIRYAAQQVATQVELALSEALAADSMRA